MSSAAKVTRLADYKPYEFEIKTTELSFDIQEGQTTVDSRLQIERVNPDATDIFLDGTDLELLRVCVNGRELSGNEYQVNEEGMTIFGVEKEFSLQVSTKIIPESNKRLMGLYKSRHTNSTQCEAQGFRRMTFYPDRPDVQSEFTNHI
ncbi:MAG: aminopeptidase N, partial [Pseudomonadales bacterium]|nr:aminopeptidase N [Pseudomonadales bacterium]